MRVPGFSGFRLHLGEAHAGRRIGNANEMLAGGALNLSPGELRLALQGLIAMGAIEFEFVGVHGLCPHKRKRQGKSM